MLNANTELTNVLQALIGVILIGMLYSLWMTTKAYGGVIGHAIRLLGVGITLISIVVIEKMLVNFAVIANSANVQIAQDVMTLLALLFLSWGFKSLAAAAKN